ncbi:MOP flippase family protein [Aequorivita marisscotiae]|uniref:MOP flippase family protein n=1 Tax=Aequorivita marisscotiae TaxID=3040348 RepID=A0ABY8KZU0_9FLAO|nr:MOP flippase family protein [Aequorivita sp. Ant34-E75]WGF93442.1 MOP flippase family protein [Aequorivita sp. Ant34-E75]
MDPIRGSVIKGVKWTTLGTIGVAICSLLRLSILARFLDKSDFGLMALTLFILGIINLFMDMGLTSAIFHKQNISKNEYSSLYWINLIFGILVFGIIFFVSPYIASFYNEPLLAELIIIMALAVLAAALGGQFKTIEHKNLNFRIIALVELTSAIISLGIAVILAIYQYGIYALIFSALFQYAVPNLFFWLRGLFLNPVRFHFKLSEALPFLKIGIYEVGSQFVNYFNRDLDIIVIGKLFSTELLGGYSLAKQLVFKPAQIINPIITKIANPLLAKFQTDIHVLKRNYLKLINIISSLNFFVYLGIIIFAPIIVTILYGSKYESIVALVRILSLYMYLRSLGNPIGSLVIATGRTNLSFYWNLFSMAIMAIFVFLGSLVSIQAVAWAVTLGFLFLFVPNWWFLVRRMTGASLTEFTKAIVPKLYFDEIKRTISKKYNG